MARSQVTFDRLLAISAEPACGTVGDGLIVRALVAQCLAIWMLCYSRHEMPWRVCNVLDLHPTALYACERDSTHMVPLCTIPPKSRQTKVRGMLL
jgi:hypothetical protein